MPVVPEGYDGRAIGISESAFKCGFGVPLLKLVRRLFVWMSVAFSQMDPNGFIHMTPSSTDGDLVKLALPKVPLSDIRDMDWLFALWVVVTHHFTLTCILSDMLFVFIVVASSIYFPFLTCAFYVCSAVSSRQDVIERKDERRLRRRLRRSKLRRTSRRKETKRGGPSNSCTELRLPRLSRWLGRIGLNRWMSSSNWSWGRGLVLRETLLQRISRSGLSSLHMVWLVRLRPRQKRSGPIYAEDSCYPPMFLLILQLILWRSARRWWLCFPW